MKFTLIVFLALAMLACLSNAIILERKNPDHPKNCYSHSDCVDGKEDKCYGGICYYVVEPKKIDTLTAEGAPKRKGYMDPLGLRKCKTNADCGDVDCIGGFCFEVVKTPKKIDTLTAEGTPKRKGAIPPTKCDFSADCFPSGPDDECCPGKKL